MAKKKPQYPHRSRNIVIGTIIAALVVGLVVGGSLGIYAWDTQRRSWIGTVFGERVSAGEFRLNLLDEQISLEQQMGWEVWQFALPDGTSMIDYAKHMAFERTMTTRIGAIKAAEYGADFLTEEQEFQLEQMLMMFEEPFIRDYLSLSDDELRQAFANSFYAENLMMMKGAELFDHDEASQEAMLAEFQDFFDSHQNELTRYSFHIIMHDDVFLMLDIHSQLGDGADFYELMAEHCMNYIHVDGGEADDPAIDWFNFDLEEELEEEPEEEFEEALEEAPAEGLEETPTEEPEEAPAEEPEEEPADDELYDELADEGLAEEDISGLEATISPDGEIIIENMDEVMAELLADWDRNLITAHGFELLGAPELAEVVFDLEIGEYSEVFAWGDDSFQQMYAIVRLVSTVAPDFDEELSSFELFEFIPRGIQAAYMELFREWLEEADIFNNRNDRAFNAITILMF